MWPEVVEQEVLKFVVLFPVTSEEWNLCVEDFRMLYSIRHRVSQGVDSGDDVVNLVGE